MEGERETAIEQLTNTAGASIRYPNELYCTVLYSAVLYCTALHCTVLQYAVLYYNPPSHSTVT